MGSCVGVDVGDEDGPTVGEAVGTRVGAGLGEDVGAGVAIHALSVELSGLRIT